MRVVCGPVGIGFGWVKAKDKVEHILPHTLEVTYGAGGLPNVTQDCASHPR